MGSLELKLRRTFRHANQISEYYSEIFNVRGLRLEISGYSTIHNLIFAIEYSESKRIYNYM